MFQEENLRCFYTLFGQSQEPAVIAVTGRRLHLASQDLALGKDCTEHSIQGRKLLDDPDR